MRFRTLSVAALLLSIGAVAAPPALAGGPSSTTWAFPGPAPCDTTLQACVNGVSAGDTIQIVANVADPDVNITKSLTIEGVPGLSPAPRLGNASQNSPININSVDPDDLTQVNVTIRNLRTTRVSINAYYPKGSGSTFEVSDLQMRATFDHNSQGSIGLTAYAPMTAIIRDNVIEADGTPIGITGLTGGTAGFGVATPGTLEARVERNVLTSPNDLSYGMQLSLRPTGGSTSHVRVYDNVVAGLGNCYCGSAAGIAVRSSPNGPAGSSVADLWHNTVVRTARGGGGPAPGVWLHQDEGTSLRVNLFDNIVALGRGPGISVGGGVYRPTVVSGFNDSFGNTRLDQWSGVAHQNHLKIDPGFVAPHAGDYRLEPASPLIDAGVVCRPGALGVLDVTGRQRLAGPMVDIGAYERGAVFGGTGVARMSGSGASLMLGTGAQDFLCGFGGLDELEGYGGNDYLDGGKGAGDFLSAGPGADVVVTKDGLPDDHADGGPGVDLCRTDPDDTRVSC